MAHTARINQLRSKPKTANTPQPKTEIFFGRFMPMLKTSKCNTKKTEVRKGRLEKYDSYTFFLSFFAVLHRRFAQCGPPEGCNKAQNGNDLWPPSQIFFKARSCSKTIVFVFWIVVQTCSWHGHIFVFLFCSLSLSQLPNQSTIHCSRHAIRDHFIDGSNSPSASPDKRPPLHHILRVSCPDRHVRWSFHGVNAPGEKSLLVKSKHQSTS